MHSFFSKSKDTRRFDENRFRHKKKMNLKAAGKRVVAGAMAAAMVITGGAFSNVRFAKAETLSRSNTIVMFPYSYENSIWNQADGVCVHDGTEGFFRDGNTYETECSSAKYKDTYGRTYLAVDENSYIPGNNFRHCFEELFRYDLMSEGYPGYQFQDDLFSYFGLYRNNYKVDYFTDLNGNKISGGLPDGDLLTYNAGESGKYFIDGNDMLYVFPHFVSTNNHPRVTYLTGTSGSGVVYQNVTQTTGGKYIIPETDPQRTGYRFKGWYTEWSDGTHISESTSFTRKDDSRLYAQWYRSYTVTFDKNCKVGSGSMKSQTINYDTTASLAKNTFSRAGYTFAGWNTQADGKGKSYSDSVNVRNMIDSGDAVTLYAQWTPNKYGIVYNANGGSGSMSSQIVNYDSSVTLRKNTFTKTGYTFDGWKGSNNVSYTDGASVNNLSSVNNGTVTMTAKWSPNKYNVKFNGNGGSGTMKDQGMTYDQAKALDGNSFKKTGYTFTGWNTRADGSGTAYTNNASVKNLAASGNVTLYAQWAANSYTISFNANNGSCSEKSRTVKYNTQYGALPTATRKGFTFAGWYTAEKGGTKVSETTVMTSASAITLYAQWNADTNIAYDANGGSGTMNDQSIPYNTTGSLNLNTFVRTGYTFKGWNTKKDGTGTSYSNGASVKNLTTNNTPTVTLYAQWSPNVYTITLDNSEADSKAEGTSSVRLTYGSGFSPSRITIPGRKGYKFLGYYNNGTQIIGADGSVSGSNTFTTENVTLKAKWQKTWEYDSLNKVFSIYDTSAVNEWYSNGKFTDTAYGKAEKIVLGNAVKSLNKIPLSSFGSCEQITVASDNGTYHSSKDGCLYNNAGTSLIYCPAAHQDNVVVEDKCTTIKAGAFAGTAKVTKVALPYSVSMVEENAFNAPTLKTIIVKNVATKFADNDNVTTKTARIYCFKGADVIEHAKKFSRDYTVYTRIEDNFFENSSITGFSIPDNITEIGKDAFRNCDELTGITVPVSVKNIDEYAFAECDKLNAVTIMSLSDKEKNTTSGTEVIGKGAFSGDKVLKTLSVGDSVKTIGDYAFNNCTGLTEQIVLSGAEEIGTGAFDSCSKLKGISIANEACAFADDASTVPAAVAISGPLKTTVKKDGFVSAMDYALKYGNPYHVNKVNAGITKIEEGEFAGNTAITEIDLSGITEIADGAFEGCTNLRKVTANDALTIGNSAFKDCTALETAECNKAETIKNEAFYGDTSLSEASLGNAKKIGESAFEKTALKTVVIPDSVESIGDRAFADDASLGSVTIGAGLKVIPEECFTDCTELKSITIPATVREIEKDAFKGCTLLKTATVKSPNTKIAQSEDTFPVNATLCGYKNSTTEIYAENYNRAFEATEGAAYIVRLDQNGGTGGSESVYAIDNNNLDTINAPLRKGYRFLGYTSSKTEDNAELPAGYLYINADGTGIKTWESVNSIQTLYAWYCETSYAINYDEAGGSFDDTDYDNEYKYGKGVEADRLAKVSREGYTFDGWYDKDGNKVDYISADTWGDIDLVAHWTAKKYKLKVVYDETNTAFSEEDMEKLSKTEYTYGEGFELPDPEKAIRTDGLKDKYFGWGWTDNPEYKDIDGSELVNMQVNPSRVFGKADDSSETNETKTLTGDKTYYFVWGLKHTKYKLTFNVSDGAVINGDSNVRIEEGETLGELPTATLTGYKFIGWYTASGYKISKNSVMGSADMQVYARWEEETTPDVTPEASAKPTETPVLPTATPGITEDPEPNATKEPEQTPEMSKEPVSTAKTSDSVITNEPVKKGDSVTVGDTDYTVTGGNTAAATDSESKKAVVKGSIIINNKVYHVTEIRDNAFKNNKRVVTVYIDKNIKYVGKNAFSGCTSLKKVTGGAGLTSIRSGAFKGCVSLSKISRFGKVRTIGKKAFYGNKKMKQFAFGDNVRAIGDYAFARSGIVRTHVWNKCKKIGTGAFSNCTNLRSIAIGKSVKTIGKKAFYGDKRLKSVTIKSKKVKTIGKKAFNRCNTELCIKAPKGHIKQFRNMLTKAGLFK